MLPTKFQVNWPFGSGEEKNRFSRWPPYGSHLGFPIGAILAIFDLQVTLLPATKFRVKWPFGSGEEGKNRFSRRHGGHLKFPIGMILIIFDLQVTLMLPTRF